MKYGLSKLGGAAALTMFVAGAGAAPIIVSFTPSAQHVNVGDVVSITMSIEGLGDEILSAMDINVLFNGGLFSVPWSISWSGVYDQLGGGYGLGPEQVVNADVAGGNLSWQMYSLLDDDTVATNQDDDFVMIEFSFTAAADGMTMFTLGSDLDFERNFVGRDAVSLDVTVQGACVAIGQGSCARQVPEPATFGLAGLALIGAGIPAWRRRRTAQA